MKRGEPTPEQKTEMEYDQLVARAVMRLRERVREAWREYELETTQARNARNQTMRNYYR